jgi:penicillin-binding protein 1A
VLWRADRDAKKPEPAMRQQTAMDMNMMMNKVVEEGTGRRALIEGVKAAGKTGTTNGYRDAWFVGFTGNFVCGVWFGNDDYTSMHNTTGGSLPAMTWQQIMSFAHQGIEAKPIPGVAPGRTPPAPRAPDAEMEGAPHVAARPYLLNQRSVQVLRRLEERLKAVAREGTPSADAAPGGAETKAAADLSGSTRGN